ncbi:MAG: hypothetical protein M3Q48_11865 [Actinomycetota bacterium]|nr:hypothetical protein [Actinomycetota bacterium]
MVVGARLAGERHHGAARPEAGEDLRDVAEAVAQHPRLHRRQAGEERPEAFLGRRLGNQQACAGVGQQGGDTDVEGAAPS